MLFIFLQSVTQASFLFSLFVSVFCFSQTEVTSDTTNHNVNEKLVVRGIDISNASPFEKDFILYMETLSDEEVYQIFLSLVDGEIVYKKED